MPSPTALATAAPFAALAPIRNVTSTGRSATNPSGWIIRIGRPSHSVVSPASKARTVRTYDSTSAHRIGLWPRMWRPVNPAPIATDTRPGAIAHSEAIAAALVIGCRRLGTRTAGPSPMRDVRSAARARTIHASASSAGESYTQART